MIRVALATESPRLASELGALLRASGRFEVIGDNLAAESESFDLASTTDDPPMDGSRSRSLADAASGSAADGDAADVVLMDAASAPGLTSRPIEEPGAAFVILSDDDDLLATLRPFRNGVALLPSAAPPEQILAAIEAAAAGLLVFHPDRAGSLTAPPADDPLTPREREVLHMLAAGLGNKEIAARLHISDHTAKFHVSQILAKLGAGTRAEAVSLAMRRGLVPL